MASKLQKGATLRRKVKRKSIIMGTILHIYKLKLKLEAIKREYLHLRKQIQEVKVEKAGEYFIVNVVTGKKGQDVLVSILETFEEMGVSVVQARVSCNCFLRIDAVIEALNYQAGIDARCITESLHKAIDKSSESTNYPGEMLKGPM